MQGIAMLASSALEETSIETAEKKHGVFTYYLLEALRNQGAVDRNGDARLSVMEVIQYVALRVRNYGQQPTILLEGSGEPNRSLYLRDLRCPIRCAALSIAGQSQ
ncbi:hypothetical protein [Candidatus Amarobacter glycogenicus]|uniref:hypothetical protein n=1 Tax=Candidatus Amarobacter glycogenicus TaxID=3140699 RepID=UPI00313665A9|nr:hypothetical protein [Dehalococcoidia bacterium]